MERTPNPHALHRIHESEVDQPPFRFYSAICVCNHQTPRADDRNVAIQEWQRHAQAAD